VDADIASRSLAQDFECGSRGIGTIGIETLESQDISKSLVTEVSEEDDFFPQSNFGAPHINA
jgi:hypothetical protein